MDLYQAIQELYEEKRRLDAAIAALESQGGLHAAEAPKRRGRKSMNDEERKEVSARMKRYWEERRKSG
jgi:hypothetical protein